jgi:hypothetical protein
MAIAQKKVDMECYVMPGSFDYMLGVVAIDIFGIERFAMIRPTKIEGVRNISTSVALMRVVYTTALPVRQIRKSA